MENYQKVSIQDDDDGHTYVIPQEMAEEFSQLLECGKKDDYVAFENKFGVYRLGGCLSLIDLYIKKDK